MKTAESEKDIIRKAQTGDKEAFRLLFEKYKNRVFAIAYDRLRSREDAEDVVQESFVKAYFSLKNFRQDSSILTWLYRIAYNLCIDEKRKKARRGGVPEQFDECLDEKDVLVGLPRQAGPQELLLRKERTHKLEDLLAKLTDDHRQVIVMREIDGLSYEEIADALQLSKGTVMSRLHYARKKLQEGLKEYASLDRNAFIDAETK